MDVTARYERAKLVSLGAKMTISVAQSTARSLTQDQVVVIRAELAAILSSDPFCSSKRCQDFLKFVVEHTLAEDYESLTERFLGVELFGRVVDYETATDSIVRVRANDVRRRLAQYNAARNSHSSVRIDLVAGGYVPEFHWRSEEEVSTAELENSPGPEPAAQQPEVEATRSFRSHKWYLQPKVWLWSAGAAAIIVALAIPLAFRLHQSNFDRFWEPVLDAPGAPVINLPTTDTFQLNLDSMRTDTELIDLKPGESLKLSPGDFIAFHDWHVSLPVLQATFSVALAMERKGKIPLVRIGTDMRRDELRGHPIIAIGSFSNPWAKQNVSGLRFTFDRGVSDRDPPRIRDSLNPQRSWSLAHIYPDPQTKDYAIVTRTFDPVTHEPFMSLAGLHSFGNQIAGEFVSQDTSWNDVARRAPAGWEKMNLQVVLEADIIGTTPGSPRILDVYFWK